MTAPAQYRRRGVVEAMQFTDYAAACEMAAWCGGRVEREAKASDPTDVAEWVSVPTLGAGHLVVRPGGWLVRDGAFSAHSDESFRATFEPATPVVTDEMAARGAEAYIAATGESWEEADHATREILAAALGGGE